MDARPFVADWGRGMTFWEWLTSLLVPDAARLALAGAAGGMVRWATLRHNWREGAAALVIGALCAVYLSPVAESLVYSALPFLEKMGNPSRAGALAPFLTGLGGITLTGFLIDVLSGRFIRLSGRDNDNAQS
jgi:hypothetical protein